VRWAPNCELLVPTPSPTLTPTGTRTPSITPSPSPSPAALCNVRLVAGDGTNTQPSEGAQAVSSGLGNVHGLVANGSLLYISDDLYGRVRRIDLRTGAISTFLGNGGAAGTYAGELATQAPLGAMRQGVVLPSGDLAMTSADPCVTVGVSQVRWAARAGGHRSACTSPAPACLSRVQVTLRVYVIAGNGTCLAAGNVALSGVASNTTAFGGCRALALWGSDGLFISTYPDSRVRLHNLTTGVRGPLTAWGGGGCRITVCSPAPPSALAWQVWWRRG
jgi:hypothetical protein